MLLEPHIFLQMGIYFCIFFSFVNLSRSYFHWNLPGSPRTDLMCPEDCKFTLHPQRCCACNAVPGRDLNKSYVKKLLAYVDKETKQSMVTTYDRKPARYYFVYTFSNNIETMPINLCHFPNIVTIQLEYNLIESISRVACLRYLDSLLLQGNRIKTLSNETFSKNKYLRFLDLSYNNLLHIEIGALQAFTAAIIHLNNNFLSEVDVVDLVLDRVFCSVHVNHNIIQAVKNENGFEINLSPSVHYGPGFVDLSNNSIQFIPEAQEFGIKNMLSMGKLLFFGFDIRDNKLDCNCKIVWYLVRLMPLFRILKRDYFNVKCYNPINLRGIKVISLTDSKLLEDLMCNYTTAEMCPTGCHCYRHYQFQTRRIDISHITPRTVINCTGYDLQAMPHRLPPDDNLHLLFSNNGIQSLEYRDYFSNVSVLDLSSNSLSTISKKAITNLQFAKEILLNKNPQLQSLSKAFASYDPCVLLSRGSITIKCSCNDLWIKEWLLTYSSPSCNASYHLKCRTESEIVIAKEFLQNLSCSKVYLYYLAAILGSTSGFILLVLLLIFNFRYEAAILFRSLRRKPKVSIYMYDLFISFDESNDVVRWWVLHSLAPLLEVDGYSVYIPIRDMVFGSIRNEEVFTTISKCKNFLTIATDSYFSNDTNWTNFEWQTLWNNYRDNADKRLIVINFDFLESNDLVCRKIKAVLRFGSVLDFLKDQASMYLKLRNRLGSPAIRFR